MAAIWREAAGADLGVGGEQPERRVGDTGARAGGAAGPDVVELESSILIVGAAWNAGDVDLIEVVLAGALKQRAELQRVVADDFGDVIRDTVDRSRRTGRIRAAVDLADIGHDKGRDLVLNFLRFGEDVGIVDPRPGALKTAALGLDGDRHAIHRSGEQEVVDRRRAQRPGVP